ncbi:MAG: PDZ domain-containing protein [Kiritimatiellae bacterium]|nr:PDZ domain-containing protein [Kiritimatiellia bacterium]
MSRHAATALWSVAAGALACAAALAMDLAEVKPGLTVSRQVEQWLGTPSECAVSGAYRIQRFVSEEEGLAEFSVWYDAKRTLLWARVQLGQELPCGSAALLFDLAGPVSIVPGHPFAAPDSAGETRHYHRDGVHVYCVGGVLKTVWLTKPNADPAAIGRAVSHPARRVRPDALWAPEPGFDERAGETNVLTRTGPPAIERRSGPGGGEEIRGGPGGTATLGLYLTSLPANFAENLGLSGRAGALVLGTRAGGRADRAGVMPEDVVVGLGGQPVDSAATLRRLLGGQRAGGRVRLTVMRDGRPRTLEVVPVVERAAVGAAFGGQWPSSLAVAADTLSPERSWGMAARGAVIRRVHPGGPAANKLLVDDVVVKYDGSPIESALTLARHVAHSRPGSEAVLTVQRRGRELNVRVRIGPAQEPNGGRLCLPVPVEDWGLSVRALNRATARAVGVGETHGLYIETVQPGTPAGEAMLAAGDVILQMGGYPALNARQFGRWRDSRTLRLAGRRRDKPFVSLLARPAEPTRQRGWGR